MLLSLYAAVVLGPGAVLLVLGPGGDLSKMRHREETVCIWLTCFFYLWLGALIFWIFGILEAVRLLWILLTLGLPIVYMVSSFLFRRIQRRRVRQFQPAALADDPAEAARVADPDTPPDKKDLPLPEKDTLLGDHHIHGTSGGKSVSIDIRATYRVKDHTVIYDKFATDQPPVHKEIPLPAYIRTEQALAEYLRRHHFEVATILRKNYP